jgi:hypothetical protein
LNGRESIMRCATTGPIPGAFSSSASDALLTSNLVCESDTAVVGVVSSEGVDAIGVEVAGVVPASAGASPAGWKICRTDRSLFRFPVLAHELPSDSR